MRRIGKAAVAMQENAKRDSKKMGKPVWAADTAAAGDTVRLTLPQEHNSMAPEALPVSVLWEDDALLILNKPPLMPVHPCPGHDRGTVCNFVSYYQKGRVKIGGSAL